MSAYEPYKHMTVEHHVLKLEFFLVFVLVDEGCFELSLLPYIEFFHLDLLCKIHSVLGHPLEDRLLCTPVDGELLVLLVIVEIVYFLF